MAIPNIQREHVLAALAEYDRVGREAFLTKYGFREARSYYLQQNGNSYDSKAIVGAAHERAMGHPLSAREFSGGEQRVARILRRLGFVVGPGSGGIDPEGERHGARRNPPWADEELILALDLYLREGLLDDKDERVIELSAKLNALPIHGDRPDAPRFRNPNAVALKLANFAALDPAHEGRGMSRGGRRDAQIWQLYAGDEDTLASAADRIAHGLAWRPAGRVGTSVSSVDLEALETERFPVSRSVENAEARRREQPLVLAYGEHLKQRGHRVVRHRYDMRDVTLFCDLFDETEWALFEAKGDVRRESVRMAVGQLLDYARLEPRRPSVAVLLPREPSGDIVSYLTSISIRCVFRQVDGSWGGT